jgi:BirA family biotin operon repressor/biotin-[acetyl-CoA-carboxylase] ligase
MAVSTSDGVIHPALLVLLADGRLHSGESLAAGLGVSRAAIWKTIERLRSLGIPIAAEPRRGYRLAQPVELLDAARIRAELGPSQLQVLRSLELLFEVDSTNTRLLGMVPPPLGSADVCLSELQSAGRGRRGRAWFAPFGASLALSMAWVFRDTGRDLPALSLAVGVAVTRALERVGAQGIRLKWPNDLWFEERKIGGVLIDLRVEAGGAAHVVIGVGLNVALPEEARRDIEQSEGRPAVAAVADACAQAPSRNRIAGATLDELLRMLVQFERKGFAPFREAWSDLDALHGRAVRVLLAERSVSGKALGVDADGALCVEVDGRVVKFVSGEVSLRLESGAA